MWIPKTYKRKIHEKKKKITSDSTKKKTKKIILPIQILYF